MRIVRLIPVCLLAVVAAGCGSSPTAPSTSSAASTTNATTITAPVAGAGAMTRAEASTSANCQPTGWGNVVFSSTELGKVTVRNDASCASDYLFVVWDAHDVDHQTVVAS